MKRLWVENEFTKLWEFRAKIFSDKKWREEKPDKFKLQNEFLYGRSSLVF